MNIYTPVQDHHVIYDMILVSAQLVMNNYSNYNDVDLIIQYLSFYVHLITNYHIYVIINMIVFVIQDIIVYLNNQILCFHSYLNNNPQNQSCCLAIEIKNRCIVIKQFRKLS